MTWDEATRKEELVDARGADGFFFQRVSQRFREWQLTPSELADEFVSGCQKIAVIAVDTGSAGGRVGQRA